MLLSRVLRDEILLRHHVGASESHEGVMKVGLEAVRRVVS